MVLGVGLLLNWNLKSNVQIIDSSEIESAFDDPQRDETISIETIDNRLMSKILGLPTDSHRDVGVPYELVFDYEYNFDENSGESGNGKETESTPFLPHPIRSKGAFKALPPKANS